MLDDMLILSNTADSMLIIQTIPQLAQLPGVHNVQEDDGLIQFHADAAHLADIMRELSAHGVQSITANPPTLEQDRKSTRLNSSHVSNSYAVFCLKKKKYT